MTHKRGRSGYTLIEVLVTMGVLGILTALLLPAVQSAREASRRVQCESNLRQIGLAVSGYDTDNGCYPCEVTTSVLARARGETSARLYYGFYSTHARLLPWLEQIGLYNAINFDVGASPLTTIAYPKTDPDELTAAAINSTAIATNLAVFLCPSDSVGAPEGGNNFRGNLGVGGYPERTFEHPDSGNGFFMEDRVTSAASIVDGLSHTVAFSERLHGSFKHPLEPQRDYWVIRTGLYGAADEGLAACRVATRAIYDSSGFADAGDHWFWEGLDRTGYTHAQVPNGKIPDCLQGALKTPPGVSTARSWHPGGVNALMGDGSVRFVNQSVAQNVWRAFGTRNGQELVD